MGYEGMRVGSSSGSQASGVLMSCSEAGGREDGQARRTVAAAATATAASAAAATAAALTTGAEVRRR